LRGQPVLFLTLRRLCVSFTFISLFHLTVCTDTSLPTHSPSHLFPLSFIRHEFSSHPLPQPFPPFLFQPCNHTTPPHNPNTKQSPSMSSTPLVASPSAKMMALHRRAGDRYTRSIAVTFASQTKSFVTTSIFFW
jgi:hypothetical protein